MIMYEKITSEDAIYTSLKDDSRTAGVILSADSDDTVTLSITIRYTVPARYAKEILREYINENSYY